MQVLSGVIYGVLLVIACAAVAVLLVSGMVLVVVQGVLECVSVLIK